MLARRALFLALTFFFFPNLGVLDGAGCPGSGIVTQAAWDAKCATCECSNFGCCRPPDCDNVACGGSGAPGGPAVPCTVTDCTICTSGGPEGHPCVRTPVLRQCSFSQGVTVMDPFQAIAKVSVVYWASTAYAWVNYAANSERSSLAFISNNASDPTTLGQSIFLGQPANVLPSQPGFGSADGPQLFYSTGVFGPLNWTVLEPRMTRVGVRLCTTGATPTCTTYSCTFGSDKPVLRPDQV